MQPFDSIQRLEQDDRLDTPANVLAGLANRLLPNRRLRDLLHGVWLGHPVHPMAVQVPVGTWTSAALLDLLPRGDGRRARARDGASRVLAATGVAAAAPAALSGLVDFAEAHREHRRVGVVHALANVTAISLYGASLATRGTAARTLRLAGLGAATLGGVLGGHLGYRQAAATNHAEDVPHLLPGGWHDVGAVADLPDGELVRRMVDIVPLVLVRRGADVYALADRCSHLSGPLHQGSLGGDGEPTVTCPWHGSCFRLRDGAVVNGPATAAQPALQTRVDDGTVHVRLAPGEP